MTEDELHEAKVLHSAASGIIPLITELHDFAYSRMLLAFKNGETNHLIGIAECNAYTTLLEEIDYKIKRLESYYERENQK